jgi:predicted lactoylglutathione lyase
MEQRISIVTLGVKDLGKSQKFYEALGTSANFTSLGGTPAYTFFLLSRPA